MLLDFILVCSVQFSTFLNVPELWRACLFNHNCLFFETRLWNSNLNGLNFAEFSHVFHHVRSSHMIQSLISGSSGMNKTRLPSLIPLTGKTVLKWVLLTFMVFNSEPIMKIKSLSWMNSISFLRNSNSMTHLFIILFHLKDFFAKILSRSSDSLVIVRFCRSLDPGVIVRFSLDRWFCNDRIVFSWSYDSASYDSICTCFRVSVKTDRVSSLMNKTVFSIAFWNRFFCSRERDSMVILKVKLIWCHRLIKFSQFEA